MRKKIIGLFLVSLFVLPMFAISSPVSAEPTYETVFGTGFVDGTEGDGEGIKLGDRDPRTIAAGIINTVLTLLGIIAVVIVLLGGFKWMTAAGNEDKVSEAKKLLGAGVIGLVIIMAAWGISTFVLDQLWAQTQ
ncbi:MAG: pilin [Patescibacteria group bacterium]